MTDELVNTINPPTEDEAHQGTVEGNPCVTWWGFSYSFFTLEATMTLVTHTIEIAQPSFLIHGYFRPSVTDIIDLEDPLRTIHPAMHLQSHEVTDSTPVTQAQPAWTSCSTVSSVLSTVFSCVSHAIQFTPSCPWWIVALTINLWTPSSITTLNHGCDHDASIEETDEWAQGCLGHCESKSY